MTKTAVSRTSQTAVSRTSFAETNCSVRFLFGLLVEPDQLRREKYWRAASKSNEVQFAKSVEAWWTHESIQMNSATDSWSSFVSFVLAFLPQARKT